MSSESRKSMRFQHKGVKCRQGKLLNFEMSHQKNNGIPFCITIRRMKKSYEDQKNFHKNRKSQKKNRKSHYPIIYYVYFRPINIEIAVSLIYEKRIYVTKLQTLLKK